MADNIGASESSKVRALQTMHEQKTRALMKSIDQLRKQVDTLKSQGKESRRTALIQSLRNQGKEQDLVVDVLKRELESATGKSSNEIDEFIIKKTLGGPKRFRPKSREELSLEIRRLRVELGKAARKRSHSYNQDSESKCGDVENIDETLPRAKRSQIKRINQTGEQDYSIDEADEDNAGSDDEEQTENVREHDNKSTRPSTGRSAHVGELLAKIEDLQVELMARERCSKAYVDTIDELRREVRDLHQVRDKLDRMSEKQGRLKQTISTLQGENVELSHQKEGLEDEVRQLESQLAQLRGELQHHSRAGKESQTARGESLELLEKIKDFKNREESMLDEVNSLHTQLSEAKQRLFEVSASKEDRDRLSQEHRALSENLAAERKRADTAERRLEKVEKDLTAKLEAQDDHIENLEETLEELKVSSFQSQENKPGSFSAADGDEALPSSDRYDSYVQEANEARDISQAEAKKAMTRVEELEGDMEDLEMLARLKVSEAETHVRELRLSLDSKRKEVRELQRDKKRLTKYLEDFQRKHRRKLLSILEEKNIKSAVEVEVKSRDKYLRDQLLSIDRELQTSQWQNKALRLALETYLNHASILKVRLKRAGVRELPDVPTFQDILESLEDQRRDGGDEISDGDLSSPRKSYQSDHKDEVFSEASQDDDM